MAHQSIHFPIKPNRTQTVTTAEPKYFDCLTVDRSGHIVRETLTFLETAQWLLKTEKHTPHLAAFVDGQCKIQGVFSFSEIHILETQYLIKHGVQQPGERFMTLFYARRM